MAKRSGKAAAQVRHSLVSLFSGAGGLDLGLEAAGFETRVCVEMDKDCIRTLENNRPWPIIPRDIATVSTAELLERGELRPREVDLVAGGPPCQPFSKSAYWSKGDTLRLADPRASTLGAFMRVVEQALPRAFLLENVFGLAYKGKDEGLQFLRQRIQEINKSKRAKYTFYPAVLSAAKFGVPQIRERVFIIGCREGGRFEFPDPRYFDPVAPERQSSLFGSDPSGSGPQPYRTAWDAIGDLAAIDHGDQLKIGGRWAGLVPSIPEGQNYLWLTERGEGPALFKWRSRYWSFLLKLAKNRPSWTVQAQPGSAIGPFHWNNRRLSMRELCRIQTFPDTFEVLGGITAVQRQLGNAVPSALAEILGLEIRRQLLGHAVSSELSTLIPRAHPCPTAEKPRPVPLQYLRLLDSVA